MTSSPEPGQRTWLLLTVLLMGLGTCGASQGLAGLGPAQALPEAQGSGGVAEVSEATRASAMVLRAALLEAPGRRALAAANVVVSALLVIAGFQLARRTPHARWWVTQACVANMVWTFGEAGSQVTSLVKAKGELGRALAAEWAARTRDAAAGNSGGAAGFDSLPAQELVWAFVALVAALALMRALVFLVLLLRVRRADMRRILSPASKDPS